MTIILGAIKPIEIIVAAVAIGIVLFTIIYNIVARKKGKGSSCCDCSNCPYSCPSREFCDIKKDKNETNKQ